jgi:hypothetical protein
MMRVRFPLLAPAFASKKGYGWVIQSSIRMIYFTKHAREKFQVLKRHKFEVSSLQVEEVVVNPDLIDKSHLPLFIAQKKIDKRHVLRVVYKKEPRDLIKIITFYPGRIKQYDN